MSHEDLPKFLHYSAHAETLSMFFEGLGIHRLGRSFPSSALIFEFLKIDGIHPAVRILYYDGETQQEEIIKLPGQTEDI